jgi:hypothetical protein
VALATCRGLNGTLGFQNKPAGAEKAVAEHQGDAGQNGKGRQKRKGCSRKLPVAGHDQVRPSPTFPRMINELRLFEIVQSVGDHLPPL